MADDECIKLCTACNTILHPEVNPMFCAAGGVIYPHLHWPLGKKLRVHFRVRNKFPTWRMESSNPRAELITSDQILDIANIWRRCGGDAIPELVKTENKQESDIRVFLSVHYPSRSYVGTEATCHEMDDTMVLNLSHKDDDFKQYIVVHEFGHALGLGHMHQSSHLANALDERLTIEWLQEESALSLEDAVKKFNADFKPYTGECIKEIGHFDASSVMCYPIGKKCFKSQTEHGLQQEEYDLITKTDDYTVRSGPSEADILALQAMYKPAVPPDCQLKCVAAQVKKFERRFLVLVRCLRKELQNADVVDFRDCITLLPASIEAEYCQFIEKKLDKIVNLPNVNELFLHLNLYWSYLQYSLLKHIIECYSDPQDSIDLQQPLVSHNLQEAMEKYEEDIEAFKSETTVGQLIEVGLGKLKMDPPPGFFRTTIRLSKDISKYTLQELDEIRRRTAEAFSLPDFIIVLERVYQSSLSTVWHIPSSQVSYFQSVSPEVLLQISAELIYFEVDDSVIFSRHYIPPSPPRPISRTPLSLQVHSERRGSFPSLPQPPVRKPRIPRTVQKKKSDIQYNPPATLSKPKYFASQAQSGKVWEHAEDDDCTGGSTGDSGLGERHSWTQHSYQPVDQREAQKYLASPAQSGKVGGYIDDVETDDYTGSSTGDSGLGERHSWTPHIASTNPLSVFHRQTMPHIPNVDCTPPHVPLPHATPHPPLHQRASPSGNTALKPLSEQEWYWKDASKEDVTELMKDMPDGAFLVRDAARLPGHYTLTLRIGGVNRLFHIMHRNGLYDFAEPLEFHSVVELIEYYREHSLASYSPKLDITLQRPLSRFKMEQEESEVLTVDYVLESLRSIEQELKEKNKTYNQLNECLEKTNEEIKTMRLEILALEQIIAIMGEGMKEHEKNHDLVAPQSKQTLLQNYEILWRRFRFQRDCHDQLQHKLHQTEMTKNCLDTELNNIKPVMKRLQVERENKIRWMQQKGMDSQEVKCHLRTFESEPEAYGDLYTTYAILHTHCNEADYQRISEEIQQGIERRTPFPSTVVSTCSMQARQEMPNTDPRMAHYQRISEEIRRRRLTPFPATDPRSPQALQQTLPQDRVPPTPTRRGINPRIRTEMVVERPPPLPAPHQDSHDDFDGQLFDYKQILHNLPQDMPHLCELNWLRPNISREGSRDALSGRPSGTFLVRPKGPSEIRPGEPQHCHTIDVVDGGKFKRIPVFRGPGGGVGFAPPYKFDSLISLVVYYATNTMEKHNPDLETCLRFPAFATQ